VSPQSLFLMNNRRVRELADALAHRVSGDSSAEKVRSVYQIALSRNPTEEEKSLGIETLTELQSIWGDDSAGALSAYCHAILNSAGFLYVD
jgi:hypothetical protein